MPAPADCADLWQPEFKMDAWEVFVLSELAAAAALVALQFVSLSVNRARILSPVRVADRGFEAIGMLFLTLVAASLPMIPNQSFRLLGAEEFAVGLAILVAIVPLQLGYLEGLTKSARRRAILQIWVNRAGAITIMVAGAGLRWKESEVNFYVLGLGILVTVMAFTTSAWAMLWEFRQKKPSVKVTTFNTVSRESQEGASNVR
jgi:hypothetical protein